MIENGKSYDVMSHHHAKSCDAERYDMTTYWCTFMSESTSLPSSYGT